MCVIDGCKYSSRVLCWCCQSDFCLQHFKQHNELLNNQINPLIDEINTLNERTITLNNEELMINYREKLDKWRNDCYKVINQVYYGKCQELKQFFCCY